MNSDFKSILDLNQFLANVPILPPEDTRKLAKSKKETLVRSALTHLNLLYLYRN